jgi:hypothetical protein
VKPLQGNSKKIDEQFFQSSIYTCYECIAVENIRKQRCKALESYLKEVLEKIIINSAQDCI